MRRPGRTLAKAIALACTAGALLLQAAPAARADAAELRARHAQLAPLLRASPFGYPLHLASMEEGNALRGEVDAVLDHPYTVVRDALREPANWCEVMILPFNTKYCHAVQTAAGEGLLVRIGRKVDQPLEQTYRLQFAFRQVAASADYFESRLEAPEGPLGTRDYRMVLAAVPLPDGRTFMRLRYSYTAGSMGRLAMQVYLATAGASKVGFTRVQTEGGGEALIGGMRGAVERNAMRYFLAINAYVDSLRAPPQQRAQRRVQAWFDATDRYPQLREMDRPSYVAMKLQELERQQTLIE